METTLRKVLSEIFYAIDLLIIDINGFLKFCVINFIFIFIEIEILKNKLKIFI